MRILAVDTATENCSVALVRDERLRSEMTLRVSASHSRHLLGAIHNVLERAGWRLADLDGLAVTRGPGSFTGLRIGISALKGLAVALAKPLVGISTLEALACQCEDTSRLICPMLDGRRGEVFTNHFRRVNGKLTSLGRERALTPKAAIDEIREPCLLVGNGALLYRELIGRRIPRWARFGADLQHCIHAVSVARLASIRLAAGETGDPAGLTPRYIRKPDATLPKNRPLVPL